MSTILSARMVKLKKCNFLDCLEATKKLLEIEYFDYLILRFLKVERSLSKHFMLCLFAINMISLNGLNLL